MDTEFTYIRNGAIVTIFRNNIQWVAEYKGKIHGPWESLEDAKRGMRVEKACNPVQEPVQEPVQIQSLVAQYLTKDNLVTLAIVVVFIAGFFLWGGSGEPHRYY